MNLRCLLQRRNISFAVDVAFAGIAFFADADLANFAR